MHYLFAIVVPSSYALVLGEADKTQAEIDAEARAWKDYFGNCVKAPIGYKTYMIEDPALHKNAEDEGEGKWVKFTPEVGPVGERKPKPFAFKTVLKGPSRLVAVKLPRPMGITFEMDSQGWVLQGRINQSASSVCLGAGRGGFMRPLGERGALLFYTRSPVSQFFPVDVSSTICHLFRS